MKLNAVGKPYGSYDPNYKLRTLLTKIGRLRKPYESGFGLVDDDQHQEKRRRRRRLKPAPLLDLLSNE
jgi:hypothetical protein